MVREPTASTTFLGSPAMWCSTAWSKPPPTISGCAVPRSRAEVLRGFAETRYAAKSWDKEPSGCGADRGERQPSG